MKKIHPSKISYYARNKRLFHVIKGFFYQMQGTKVCTVLKQSQLLQMHFSIHL
jgi:hypothetical protein